MLTVFIGDLTEYLSDIATKVDRAAYLCTNENYSTTITGTVYTSLADLSVKNFHSLVEVADSVTFCDPKVWSSEGLRDQTYIHLNFLNNKKSIQGFTQIQHHPEYLSVADTRKTDGQQIWVVGCSFSHGVGVAETEKYGQLLSKKLGLPVSYLTDEGTSIKWAADQILRADIQEQDIVIWGITGSSRIPYLDENDKLYHLSLVNYNQCKEFTALINKNLFVSNHMCYESIPYIDQVVKYLDNLGTKYIMGVFPLNINEHESKLLKYISQFNNSILLYTDHTFLDFGSDNIHPGVLQHQWYANTIFNFLHQQISQ